MSYFRKNNSEIAGTLVASEPSRVSEELSLKMHDMVSLYRSIQVAPQSAKGRIIEVISPQGGEGVSSVVRALAEAASVIGNARVLVCDADSRAQNFRYYGLTADISLHQVLLRHQSPQDAIVSLPGQRFALCALSDLPDAQMLADLNLLDEPFEIFRSRFELVLIDAPPCRSNGLGPALAGKADGVILVVEAEKTRSPTVTAAQRVIEINGGNLLGVVLNKRQLHIPSSVYRWL